jgi:hypothetical protein
LLLDYIDYVACVSEESRLPAFVCIKTGSDTDSCKHGTKPSI